MNNNNKKSIFTEKKYGSKVNLISKLVYVFIQLLCQDVTQGQFLSRVS